MLRSRFLLALSLLAVVGFGCKPDPTLPPRPTQALNPAPTVLPPSTNSSAPKEDVAAVIRAALTKLEEQPSYRVTLVAETPAGVMTGDTAYVKGKGAHGKLLFPGQISTEFYELPDTLWFKVATSSWAKVTSTPETVEAIGFTKAQREYLGKNTGLLAEGTQFVEVRDDRGCRMYVLERESNDGRDTSQICIKDGLPTFLSGTSLSRKIELRIRDLGKDVPFNPPK